MLNPSDPSFASNLAQLLENLEGKIASNSAWQMNANAKFNKAWKLGAGLLVIALIFWAISAIFFSAPAERLDTPEKISAANKALSGQIDELKKSLAETVQKAENAARVAEKNANNHSDELFWTLASMDTSMADSLSKRFKGQLAAVAKSAKTTAAAVDSLRADVRANGKKADAAFNLGMAAMDSAMAAQTMARVNRQKIIALETSQGKKNLVVTTFFERASRDKKSSLGGLVKRPSVIGKAAADAAQKMAAE